MANISRQIGVRLWIWVATSNLIEEKIHGHSRYQIDTQLLFTRIGLVKDVVKDQVYREIEAQAKD